MKALLFLSNYWAPSLPTTVHDILIFRRSECWWGPDEEFIDFSDFLVKWTFEWTHSRIRQFTRKFTPDFLQIFPSLEIQRLGKVEFQSLSSGPRQLTGWQECEFGDPSQRPMIFARCQNTNASFCRSMFRNLTAVWEFDNFLTFDLTITIFHCHIAYFLYWQNMCQSARHIFFSLRLHCYILENNEAFAPAFNHPTRSFHFFIRENDLLVFQSSLIQWVSRTLHFSSHCFISSFASMQSFLFRVLFAP